MNSRMPEPTLSRGDTRHGFRIEEVTPLPDLYAVAYRGVHVWSGARLLHLHAPDEENLLALAFRTPPTDSTGLPHILEHTVLCGSRRYPVKDPFVELLKTSLATFLNAMTYPDKTVYPCASMNRKDFFNAAGVYCDAVFHPLITEQHFRQEGHHLAFADPADPDSPMIVKGIVFNEMKGVYSTLDGVLGRAMEQLFPDNAYGLDSGGDPERIPDLTYAQFKEFHRRYYHPSNAFIFLYGDIPTVDHLEFLDREYLRHFTRLEIDTAIRPQPFWSAPRRLDLPYPAAPDDDPARRTALLVGWLCNPITDYLEAAGLDLLGEYLLGHAGSPLRKALVDSKLGEDLTHEGYDAWRRDTMFSVGLKGSAPDRLDDFVRLTLDTCRALADRGLDPAILEACFHQAELDARDVPPQYPLHLMNRVYNSWIYDGDPLLLLRPRDILAQARRRLADDPSWLAGLLRRRLVENPHRLEVVCRPDPGLNARREAAWADRMKAAAARLDRPAREHVAAEARRLDELQQAPNSPAALATLPRLRLADVPPEPQRLDVAVHDCAGRPLLRSDVFANGLSHVELALDLSGLPDDLWDWLPLFTDALSKTGAEGSDFAELARREAACCGGIEAAASVTGVYDNPDRVRPLLTVGGTALDENLPAMLDILLARLQHADFRDGARLRDIIRQGRVRRRNAILHAGNAYAAAYAARGLSLNAALAERLTGVSQVRFFERLVAQAGDDLPGIVARLERLRSLILKRARLYASFVGADAPFDVLRDRLFRFSEGLGAGRKAPAALIGERQAPEPRREGVALPSDVAYVALAVPAVGASHPLAPALHVLATHLSYDYLWTTVRVRGGAYGAGAGYQSGVGIWTFSSYRDPNVAQTLAAYRRVPEVVRAMDRSAGAVEQMIIGTLKSLDRPIRPGQAVSLALARRLTGWTDTARREYRARLLAVRGEDLLQASESILAPQLDRAPVCVVGGRALLETAGRDDPPSTLTVEPL